MDNFSKQIYDAGKIEATFNNLKALMSTMNVSLDKAMDMLKTLTEERQLLKDLLAKEM